MCNCTICAMLLYLFQVSDPFVLCCLRFCVYLLHCVLYSVSFLYLWYFVVCSFQFVLSCFSYFSCRVYWLHIFYAALPVAYLCSICAVTFAVMCICSICALLLYLLSVCAPFVLSMLLWLLSVSVPYALCCNSYHVCMLHLYNTALSVCVFALFVLYCFICLCICSICAVLLQLSCVIFVLYSPNCCVYLLHLCYASLAIVCICSICTMLP